MKKQLFSLLLICSFNLFGMETPQLEQPLRTSSPELLNQSNLKPETISQAFEGFNNLSKQLGEANDEIKTLKAKNQKLEAHLDDEVTLRRQFVFNPIYELGNRPVSIRDFFETLRLSGVSVSSKYGAFSPEMLQVTVENQNGRNGNPLDIEIDVNPIVEQTIRTLPFSQRHPRITNTATFTFGAAIMGALCWNGWFQEKWDTTSNYCSPIVSRLSTFFNR